MPVVEVVAKRFFKKLGREMAEDELAVFLFSYGLELDDIVSEREKHLKQTGIDDPRLSDEKLLKIEVPANRYDLLCEEGICRALNIFLGNFEMPQYQLTKSTQKIIVESSVDDVRPFVVCAILRNIDISDEVVYNNFIALQTKLHLTVCRKRTLASIGTHDLDTLQGPFVYKALPPQDIKFVPLNKTKEVDGHELMEVLKDSHLGPYLDIIKDKPRYPVIYDKNNVVMSVPPIINGEHSKIHSKTKNILVEVTATDLTKANIALNTVVTMFSEYCSKVFQIEQVETEYVTKKSVIAYPIFEKRDIECEVTYLSRGIGIEVDPTSVVGLLKKMGINSTLSKDKKNIVAEVSPTRTDIFHKCDLVEDVAIAFGFDKIPFNTPSTLCYGSQYQVNYISDKVRGEVARNGYTELLTFSLLSTEENYGMLNITEDSPYYKQCVVIANPATVEFQVARTSLLPGLLKTLENNKEVPVPLKVFEVSDVVFLDNTTDTGARNRRHLCAVFVNTTSSFEIVHSLLDKLMVAFNFKFKDQSRGYHIEHNDHPTYLKGRRGTIISTVNGVSKEIGYLGVLHPKVVLNFKLLHVVCALELDVQFLVDN